MSKDCDHHHHPSDPVKPISPPPEAQAHEVFRVTGMDCPEEVAAIERALKPVHGVLGVQAEIVSSKVTVYHDGSLERERIGKAINQAGVSVLKEGDNEARRPLLPSILVSLSGTATGLGLLLQLFGGSTWPPDIAFFAAILAGGWLVLPKAWRSVRTLTLDMNVLMTIAVIGAVAIGEHAEGAAVVFLFALSELLESWSVGRARQAIRALMKLAPETALVKRDGQVVEVESSAVEVGETILVKSGQRIPLDGTVASGDSAIDQSPITGESMPVEKSVGDQVFAGTINGDGSLEIEITKAANDTTLSRIIQMVEDAQSSKAPAQRFVDSFAKIYTPSVMALALVLALAPPLLFGQPWMDWFYRALVLLVIACPCALVIATPVSVVSGLTALARRGVLVKGGASLEALGGLKALALDKTGTITEGQPRVVDVQSVNATTEEEILRVAAAIDTHSTHPLAQAVTRHADEIGVTFTPCNHYKAIGGRGAEGVIDGHAWFVGNHRFAHELGVCSDELETRLSKIEEAARSVVVVGHKPHGDCGGEVVGLLAIADTIRPGAKEALRKMHEAGLEKVVMLSGDNTKTARAIADEVGIDEAFGDLLPEDKIERVKALEKEFGSVGMIGDGVNDAPALAAATVGIAMGAAGTDTAIETADIALMRDDLAMVSEAIHLGRRTRNTIRFNIVFALGVKAIFLILAVFGLTSLWLAILADTGTTLLVILNALRLLQPPSSPPPKGHSKQIS